jgi:hypothetical protein
MALMLWLDGMMMMMRTARASPCLPGEQGVTAQHGTLCLGQMLPAESALMSEDDAHYAGMVRCPKVSTQLPSLRLCQA